jgi:choline dehydrogenase-like flavoprotein
MKKGILAGLFLSLITAISSLTASDNIVYDYIIVGNGTVGSVLARKLTDSNKKKVLVLEAGVNQDNDPVVLNTTQGVLFQDLTLLTYDPKYAENYPCPVFNPLTAILYSEGRGWGGSSKHNYMQVVRGTPGIYNQWAAISGNPFWSYNNLLPKMQALENYTPCMSTANSAQRGVGGPISVTQTPPITSDPLGMALAAATNAGFITDINDPTEYSTTGLNGLGFSAFQMFATSPSPCTTGQRSYSSKEFLPPSILKPTATGGMGVGKRLLRIESNAYVNKVLFDGNKAIGVQFVYSNAPNKTLKAYGKKIILCAGSVNSPAILQRSGIGPASVLEPLGIKVRVNNPNVGANLINQYGGNAIVANITTTAHPFLQGFINGSATPPLAAPYNYPDDTTRRIQMDAFQASVTPFPIVEILNFLLEPKSRGSLQIVSTNPLVQPQINLNMFSDGPVTTNGTDANLTVAAYLLIGNSIGGGGPTYPNMIYPSAAQLNAGGATLLAAAETASGITAESHIVGTAVMGTSMANAVVDGTLHVFGVKNLMVADASVIPVPPDGNICYGVYMIALGAAAILGVPTPPAL